MKLAIKIILTLLVLAASGFVGLYSFLLLGFSGGNIVCAGLSVLILPGLLIPLIWCK